MKTTAPELDKLVQNILLYADEKSVFLTEVFFVTGGSLLNAYSSDGYVAIGDQIEVEDTSEVGREFALSVADAKELGDWIKKDKKVVHKSEINVKFLNTLVKFTSPDFDGELKVKFTKPDYDKWDRVFDLLSEEQELLDIPNFTFRPDRLAKLARIKAEKEAPIVFRGIDYHTQLMIQFKKGTTVTGVIMPVDTSYVQEEFLWPKQEEIQIIPGDIVPSRSLISTATAEKSTDSLM